MYPYKTGYHLLVSSQFPSPGLFLVLQIHGRACVHLTLLEISMVRDPLTCYETRRKLVSVGGEKATCKKILVDF